MMLSFLYCYQKTNTNKKKAKKIIPTCLSIFNARILLYYLFKVAIFK